MLKKHIGLIFIITVCAFHAGCATLADAKAARGSGEYRIYAQPKYVVWKNLVEVLNSVDLEIVTQNESEGMILAQRSMTAFSYGENVAIFVEQVNGKTATRVEVVNKRTLSTNITAANWAKRIFQALDQRLM